MKVATNFRLEIIKNVCHVFCDARIIKYCCFTLLAIKWVGLVDPCAATMRWVCKLMGLVRLSEEKVTPCPSLMHLHNNFKKLVLARDIQFQYF